MACLRENDLQKSILKIINESGVDLYGFAFLGDIGVSKFQELKYAISVAVKLEPSVVDGITLGPTEDYCEEYKKINLKLDTISSDLENEIKRRGHNALSIPASKRTDSLHLRGEFPHKTAATRAGLGWIGKNSLLVTRKYGPRVRLATILTDFPLDPAKPVGKSYCGKCRECVDTCPAGAIVGEKWFPGLEREKLVNVFRCDEWKKENYYAICEGRVCGICIAVCPFGKSERTDF